MAVRNNHFAENPPGSGLEVEMRPIIAIETSIATPDQILAGKWR
jgi:hypothetical protein